MIDIDVAERKLESMKNELAARKSDADAAERRLRDRLGLPPADGRQIIPATPAIGAPLEPDWDASLAEMLAHQPDIVQQGVIVRLAELGLLIARNQLLPVLGPAEVQDFRALGVRFDRTDIPIWLYTSARILRAVEQGELSSTAAGEESPEGFVGCQRGYAVQLRSAPGRSSLPNARAAQHVLLRSRAVEHEIRTRATYALARSFLEIEATYRQLRMASRRRIEAARRLEVQRSHYEEGRIAADRYLDAIRAEATAEATEARCRALYNIAFVAFEEARGSLLAAEDIVIADSPRPPRTRARPAG